MPQPKPWQHDFLAIDGADDIPGASDLLALWRGRRGGRMMPAWSDFEMIDFRPWIGNVSVDEIRSNPFDCVTRLWGTGLTALYGFDATGRSLRDSYELRGLTPEDFAFWERVALTPCIGIGRGTIDWQNREHVSVMRVFLPLAGATGLASMIMAVAFTT